MKFWQYSDQGRVEGSKLIKTSGALLMASAIALSFGGCKLIPKEKVVQAPALVAPAKVDYKLDKVQRGTLVKIFRGKGTLMAANEQNCFFEYGRGGHIKALHVKPGDEVKKGQLLAELNTGDLPVDIKRAEIRYELEKLRYEQAKANSTDEYTLKTAELNFELAKLDYDQIKKEGDKAKIYAGMSGKITNFEAVNVGDFVEAFKPIMTISSTDTLRLRYKVFGDSDFIQGMKAVVTYGGLKLDGKIAVARKLPEGTEIEISIEKLPSRATFREYVDFEIETVRLESVIKVPKSAVHEFDNQAYVERLENGIRVEKYVKLGLKTDDEVEIIDGLTEGEEIIVE